MKYYIKMGKEKRSFELDEEKLTKVMLPKDHSYTIDEEKIIVDSLENPIGSHRISEIIEENEKIVIVVSGIENRRAVNKLLPYLIDEISISGAKKSNISIVLASGNHRPLRENEQIEIVGKEIYQSEIQVINSNPRKCDKVGTSKRGIDIEIFYPILDADRVICVGNIEYHYFTGYNGGAKTIMSGASSKKTMRGNHEKMFDPNCKAGILEGNTAREEIDQLGAFIKIDFILDIILDDSQNIIHSVSGNYLKAHRQGCKKLDELYGIDLQEKADIVVVSPGGSPNDMNLYKSLKALNNAKMAVKKDGIIVLVASIKDGFGEYNFAQWLKEKTPEEMVEDIKKEFVIGGHKAAVIGEIMLNNKIYCVSDLDGHVIRKIGFKSFVDVQDAIETAIEDLGEDSKLVFMPSGNETLPVYKAGK